MSFNTFKQTAPNASPPPGGDSRQSARAAQLVEAGLWLRLNGDRAGARALLEQALAVDPSHLRARRLLDASIELAETGSSESDVAESSWGDSAEPGFTADLEASIADEPGPDLDQALEQLEQRLLASEEAAPSHPLPIESAEPELIQTAAAVSESQTAPAPDPAEPSSAEPFPVETEGQVVEPRAVEKEALAPIAPAPVFEAEAELDPDELKLLRELRPRQGWRVAVALTGVVLVGLGVLTVAGMILPSKKAVSLPQVAVPAPASAELEAESDLAPLPVDSEAHPAEEEGADLVALPAKPRPAPVAKPLAKAKANPPPQNPAAKLDRDGVMDPYGL